MQGFLHGRSKAKLGYACVSARDRNLNLQLNALEKAGCEQIFREMSSSSNRRRPELQRMLHEIQPGDTVVVWKLDRLARSTRDLLETMERINKAGGGVQLLSEPWANTATDAGHTIMTVLAGFAEFERALTRERHVASLQAAKQHGVRLGRPPKLKPAEFRVGCQLLADGNAIRDVAKPFSVNVLSGDVQRGPGLNAMRHVAVARRARSTYLLKIRLLGIEPPIWRRIEVPSSIKLCCLHNTLQVVMGWTDSHLHSFEKDGTHREAPEYGDLVDESKTRLAKLLKAEGESLIYFYDFVNKWRHEVVLERIIPVSDVVKVPLCIGGERRCPPEDVRGVRGYREFMKVISDPKNENYEQYVGWVGGHFVDEFDLEAVNETLTSPTAVPRSRREKSCSRHSLIRSALDGVTAVVAS